MEPWTWNNWSSNPCDPLQQLMARAGKQKKESAAEKRQRRQLNHKVHEQAFYVWAGAGAILLCVLWVVYYVATRPKAMLDDDEGRRQLEEAVAKLLESNPAAAEPGS